ncbi:MAG: molybdopterin molybdotransferase MoeA [Defluviitaleaceae bacterium]|nr:molybdopterin molybdotransferase MoeA [Defluviitaleaceae bacterium]
MKFLQVESIEKVREKLLNSALGWFLQTEYLPLSKVCGKVLTEDILSRENSPNFRRSMVDGYALKFEDAQRAGEDNPAFLKVVGTVKMGVQTTFDISDGECAEIPTGGMLPEGADAVVMFEYCETAQDDQIAVYHSVSKGSYVVNIGDDMKEGALLLPKGKCLTPHDIGILAVAGIKDVPVVREPVVSFLSTGNELVTPHYEKLEFGKIRETNILSLSALAEKVGYKIGFTAVLPDDEVAIKAAVAQAMETSDVVVISGGSAKGKLDLTAKIIDDMAKGGLFAHGIALKPGKSTVLRYDEASKTLLAGLPGHPIAAMTVFEMLFGWLLRELVGSPPPLSIPAILPFNVPGDAGKLTAFPCRLELEGGVYTAHPIHYRSGLIANLTAAHGYFLIDKDTEGLQEGESVLVHLY